MEYYQSLRRINYKSLNARYPNLDLVDMKEQQRCVLVPMPILEGIHLFGLADWKIWKDGKGEEKVLQPSASLKLLRPAGLFAHTIRCRGEGKKATMGKKR